MSPPLLAIVGPTASGKTALAIELAQRWDAEIVGVDASQVYRGLDVGTGKATPAELGPVRHHLVDVVDPDAAFTAGAYVKLADAAITDAWSRGRRVILCGGTGLYLRALVEGLCEAPPVAGEVRSELQARMTAGEVQALHAELRAVDPEAAARIGVNDAHRIERALGVFRSTGRTLTEWQAAQRPALPRYPVRVLGLAVPRQALRARIAERTRDMFSQGLVEEVAALEARGYTRELKSLQALGYRQASAVLHRELRLDVAIAQTITATAQYAKRQETWFRRLDGVEWLTPEVDPEALSRRLDGLWEAR